jgi:hypothetical protein
MKVREVAIATDGFAALTRPRQKISARFAIANEGETEAKILEVRATIYKTEESLPMMAPHMENILPSIKLLRPGFITEFIKFSDDKPLACDVARLYNGWMSLYIMGNRDLH